MVFRALIVEDEDGSRERLTRLLGRHAEVSIVGEAASGPQALELVTSLRPDLVFLDVSLPGFDGFALLDEIDAGIKVIFTTASQEHAVRAFDAGAVHYLLKPIDSEQLRDALARLQSIHASPNRGSASRLLCRDRDMTHVLRADEILFVKADQGYTLVRTAAKEFLSSDSLGLLEEQMGRTFVRVHRNALVNIDHVSSLRHVDGDVLVVLRNGMELSVSRRHAQTLRERLLYAAG
jgi:DNA-binding LytR/AlgR family response regulator